MFGTDGQNGTAVTACSPGARSINFDADDRYRPLDCCCDFDDPRWPDPGCLIHGDETE